MLSVVGGDHVRVVDTAAAFLDLGRTWRELWVDSPLRSPFASWEFAQSWWRHFVAPRRSGPTGAFKVLVAEDAARRVLGLAPMFEENNLGSTALGTTLQPFGRSNCLETMTDEPMVVLRRGAEARALDAFRAHLTAGQHPPTWDLAVANAPELADQPAPAPTRTGAHRHGQLLAVGRRLNGPVTVDLPLSWDEYRTGLSKSMRDNVAYYPRRLQREVGPYQVRILRGAAGVTAATPHLIRLHRLRSRWPGLVPHRDHIPGSDHAAFMMEALRMMADAGLASVATLTVAGEVIAAQAFLEASPAAWMYYSGFDPRWQRFSPLTIITARYLQEAIHHGVRQFHFSPGQAPWKARWGAQLRGHFQETSIYSLRAPALMRGVIRRLRWRHEAAVRSARIATR